MDILTPIASAVLQAGSVTIDKIVLNIKRVTYKTYTGISFPLILLINAIIFFIFLPKISSSMFSYLLLFLIIVSSIIGIVGNLLFYRALKKDCLNEMEAISLFSNIPLIIFTSLFFVSERNYFVIVLALISSLAIIWSHWKNHHLKIAKPIIPYLIFILLISPFRGLMSKVLLQSWDPISLQLATGILPALFFFIYFFKSVKETPNKKAWLLLIATNILTTIAWILYYFSYQKLGIVETVLIFSLQPLLVYFSSILIIKEKFHWKKFVAFMIIVACIALSQVL